MKRFEHGIGAIAGWRRSDDPIPLCDYLYITLPVYPAGG